MSSFIGTSVQIFGGLGQEYGLYSVLLDGVEAGRRFNASLPNAITEVPCECTVKAAMGQALNCRPESGKLTKQCTLHPASRMARTPCRLSTKAQTAKMPSLISIMPLSTLPYRRPGRQVLVPIRPLPTRPPLLPARPLPALPLRNLPILLLYPPHLQALPEPPTRQVPGLSLPTQPTVYHLPIPTLTAGQASHRALSPV